MSAFNDVINLVLDEMFGTVCLDFLAGLSNACLRLKLSNDLLPYQNDCNDTVGKCYTHPMHDVAVSTLCTVFDAHVHLKSSTV